VRNNNKLKLIKMSTYETASKFHFCTSLWDSFSVPSEILNEDVGRNGLDGFNNELVSVNA